jgi:hypothetical protein
MRNTVQGGNRARRQRFMMIGKLQQQMGAARSLLAVCALLALCFAAGSCGGGEAGTASVVSNFSTHNNDRDNDGDHNDDDGRVLGFGQPADPSGRRAITELITRYFAAATAGDGARACAMLEPRLRVATVAQDGGPSATLHGATCATVMTKQFELRHRELVEKNAALRVIAVRVKGGRAIGVLDFPEIPEVRQFVARVSRGRWTAFSRFDGIIE